MQDSGQALDNPQGIEGQSVPATEVTPEVTTQPDEVEVLRQKLESLEQQKAHFQSIADRRYQELLLAQAKLTQVPSGQSPEAESTNPYNMQNDFPNWFRYEQKRSSKEAVQEAIGQIFQRAESMTRAQQESQWVASHPGVDIEAVKAFGQVRGVRELDDAYALMTMTQREAGVAASAVQQTVNQIRQPNTATPLRGQPVGQPGKQSYESLLTAYNANPDIEKAWTPQLREAFWEETRARDYLIRKGKL